VERVSPQGTPVYFVDPFQAHAVWQGIDERLTSDVRRASVGRISVESRGQERMRDVFVRRSSEEAGQQKTGKLTAKVKGWLKKCCS
jgi:hypothetical protein